MFNGFMLYDSDSLGSGAPTRIGIRTRLLVDESGGQTRMGG